MKKLSFLTIVMLSISFGNALAQIDPDPAHWSYGLKKVNANVYEIHLQCKIDSGWHIYAQTQPPEAVAVPTKITFSKVFGLRLIGKTLEIGKKEKFSNAEVGISNLEFSGKVDFVQKVSMSHAVHQIKVTIQYQTCTHKKCLSANSVEFNIPINEHE